MALMVDTNVFIRFEKTGQEIDLKPWEPAERVYVSVVGAHDLIIAATARQHDFSILTDNVDEYSRVPGLQVIPFES